MDITQFSDEALRLELNRRERERNRAPKPFHIDDVDWADVYKTCVDAANRAAEDQYDSSDYHHHIYKSAMDAVFGFKYWAWLNRVC